MKIFVGDRARDYVELEYEWHGDKLIVLQMERFGCFEFVQKVEDLVDKLSAGARLSMNGFGQDHVDVLLKELFGKLYDEWKLPYDQAQLCHCRMVPTENVQKSIYAGAKNTDQVGRWTSAGVSCGSCRSDIQNLLDYYLGKSS